MRWILVPMLAACAIDSALLVAGCSGNAAQPGADGGAVSGADAPAAAPDGGAAGRPDAPAFADAAAPIPADAPAPGTQPQPGHSFLTVQGDTEMSLRYGATVELVVRFANENQVPLAGVVTFRIEGAAAGSILAAASGTPDFDGYVHTTLTAGTSDATFRVVAEAPYAAAVAWNVGVVPPSPPPPPPPDAPPPVYTVAVVGSKVVMAPPGTTVPLTLRLTDAQGQPVAHGFVNLAMSRSDLDFYLSDLFAATDANGIGTFSVLVGSTTLGASVEVFAYTGYANSVGAEWVVVSVPPAFGVGTYSITSSFALPTPLDADPLLHDLSDMVDGATDPGTWLLDAMIAEVPSLGSSLSPLRPGLDAAVASSIDGSALRAAVHELEAMTKGFGEDGQLQVAVGADGSFKGFYTLSAYRIDVDGMSQLFYATGVVPVIGVPITIDGEHIQIGALDPPVYGGNIMAQMLPSIPSLMDGYFACDAIGYTIDSQAGLTASFWTSICNTTLAIEGQRLDDERRNLGSAGWVQLHLATGDAQLLDVNGDGEADTLTQGVWMGTATVNGAGAVPLGAGQSFTGSRIGN
jgi:hypothetical protein